MVGAAGKDAAGSPGGATVIDGTVMPQLTGMP